MNFGMFIKNVKIKNFLYYDFYEKNVYLNVQMFWSPFVKILNIKKKIQKGFGIFLHFRNVQSVNTVYANKYAFLPIFRNYNC